MDIFGSEDRKVEELLKRLENPRVQTAIRRIVSQPVVTSVELASKDIVSELEEDDIMGKKIDKLEETLKKREDKIKKLEKELEEQKEAKLDLEAKYKKVKMKLEDAEDDNARLQKTKQSLEYDKRTLQDNLQQLNSEYRALDNSYKTLEKQHIRTENKLTAESKRVDNLQAKNNDLEEKLAERCAKGYQLFTDYRLVSAYIKNDVLCYTVRHDSFEAFIASLSQYDTAGKIWDALRELLMRECSQEEWDELYECMEYAVYLTNSFKGEEHFSFAETEAGTRFDSDMHQSTPGSKAQGNIQEVYLPGIINNHNGKFVRKSIVSV